MIKLKMEDDFELKVVEGKIDTAKVYTTKFNNEYCFRDLFTVSVDNKGNVNLYDMQENYMDDPDSYDGAVLYPVKLVLDKD